MSPGCLAIAGQPMDEDDTSNASMVSSVERLCTVGPDLYNWVLVVGELITHGT
jgi:hypothetical protein